ncbi:hypothetical protein GCM10023165_26500 [Variovorax defluvii]|uniref:Type I restriction enzyme endonuclease subunit n=1 Tax=Variovorax defluvii TaxID=913761 RepID=A0ABP8HSN2_9BURK
MSVTAVTADPSPARIDALHLLCKLGWNYIGTAECLALRGSTRRVLLKPRLIEFLQSRRFDYRGDACRLSPGAIDQILRELSAVGLGEGLLAANERLYAKLACGITVTEFMPDGQRHQPTIQVIDWTEAKANRFDVTDELDVLSSHGTHHRTPDVVGFVNGIPLVVIEAREPQEQSGSSMADAMVRAGIDAQLRNQREDEIPHLFAYAQLLLSIGRLEGRYGTTATPARLWARWDREEEFDDAHVSVLKNSPLSAAAEAALFHDQPHTIRESFGSAGAHPSPPNDQDRLLVSLLTPQRLLDLLRGFVLFDSRIGKIVARHQQFFGVRALLRRLVLRRADGAREGGVIWHTAGSGKSFTMVFLAKALLLHEDSRECRLVVITDRRDLEGQLARNFMAGGAFGASIATQKEGEQSKAMTGRDLARRIGRGTKRITFALLQKFHTASRLVACRNDSPDIVVLVDEGHRSHGGELHARMKKALPRAAYVAFTGTPLLKDEKTAQKFGPIVHAYTMQRAVLDRAVVPLLYEERMPELSVDAEAVDRWFDGITAGLAPAQRAALKKKYARSGAIHGAPGRIALIAWDIATHFHQNIKSKTPGLKGQLATASKLDAIRYKKALVATGLVTSEVVISPPDLREGITDIAEAGMLEVQAWWKQNVLDQGVDTASRDSRVLQSFGTDDGPDLLIVVDRLLTGFDEPRNAVLYIDKPLKGHTLIQAVARVNRLHEAKRHGLLVDYRGILKELDTAVRAYQNLETRTQGGFDIGDLEGLYARVGTRNQQVPAPAGSLPDEHIIGTGVHENDSAPYLVHGLCAPEVLETWSPDKARSEAALMQARLRKAIEQDLADDPYAQKVFSELLKDAIAQAEALFDHPRRQYALLRAFERDVDTRATPGMPNILANSPKTRAYYGAILLALGEEAASLGEAQRKAHVDQALAIGHAVEAAMAEHSLSPQDIESTIRKSLLQLLYAPLGLARTNEVIGHVLRVTRVSLARQA